MAPNTAVNDPPVSVREKGGRIVVVFNVSNVKPGSIQVESRPASADEPAGSVRVAFSSVSPTKAFEKHLVLPYGIDSSKTVKDVQSKSLTVQLVKLDPSAEWGQAWLKPAKGKAKSKPGSTAKAARDVSESPVSGPASPPATPSLSAQADMPKAGGLDDLDDVPDASQELEEQLRREQEEQARKGEEKEAEKQKREKEQKDQEKKEQERREQQRKEQEKQEQQKKEQQRREQEKKEQQKKEQQKKEQEKHERKELEKKEQDKKKKEQDQQNSILDGLDDEFLQGEEPPKAGGKAKARRGGKAKKKAQEPAEEQEEQPSQSQQASMGLGSGKSPKRVSRSRGAANRAQPPVTKKVEKEGFPLLPPSDSELQQLVSEGTSTFEEDPKKATVLLRLAGRKGYLPAYLLLAQLANGKKDDALMIETFCALLTTPGAQTQMPKQLLSNCAVQLAAALRDPKNKAEVEAHAADIEDISKEWPIVTTVTAQQQCAEDIRNVLVEKQQELLRLGQQSSKLEEDRRKEAKDQLQDDFQRMKDALSLKTTQESTKSEVDRIKAAMAPKPEFQEAAKTEMDRIKAAMAPKAQASSSSAKFEGTWHDEGSSWRFEVKVLGLAKFADARLDISKAHVRLRGPDGENLVCTSTPDTLDTAKAEASWLRKQSLLQVTGPKRSSQAAAPTTPPAITTFDALD